MWQTTDYRDLSLTEITDMFSNHFSAHKRNMRLNKLARQGLVTVEEVQTGGRQDPGPLHRRHVRIQPGARLVIPHPVRPHGARRSRGLHYAAP